MVQGYIERHKKDIEKVYEKVDSKRKEVYIVRRLDQKHEKFIKNDMVIKLDVFDNTSEEQIQDKSHNVSVKTLLKYPVLS